MKVAIIGGGISGLTTAFYLKHFEPETEVTLFEKEAHLGGKMSTVDRDGFMFEEGTNGFLSNKPATLELVKDAGCEDILIRSNDSARIRYIYKNALELLPESPGAFLKTPLLSLWGKIRVACEVFIPAKKDDSEETLQSFGYRRVGKEMTDSFLDPMVAGVFASTPEKISVNAAFPLVVKLEKEHGGLFRGMLAKKKKSGGPGGVLMSFSGGVSHFVQRLSKAKTIDIRTGVDIQSIEKKEKTFVIAGESFDKVVICTEAFVASKLLQSFDKEISQALDQIEYSPISVVGLGYEHLQHPLDGFGLLTTTSAKKEILGVLWDSSIFDDRAPKGKKSLRIMIGGQRDKALALKTDDELLHIAINGVKETMGVDQKPDVSYVKRWEKGIPNYRVGHLSLVEQIYDLESKIEGIYLNSNAYRGVALNDCVANSKACTKRVLGID